MQKLLEIVKDELGACLSTNGGGKLRMMLGTKTTKEGPLGIWVYCCSTTRGARSWQRRRGIMDSIAGSLANCEVVLVSLEQQS